jgi:hypothetical protein
MRNFDLVNAMTVGQSVVPAVYTGTQTGSAVDFKDCGPEIGVIATVGAVSGTTPTFTLTLQQCMTSGGTYTAISGFTMTCNTASLVYTGMCINRGMRYVQAVATLAGSSPSFAFGVILMADIHSMQAAIGSGLQ